MDVVSEIMMGLFRKVRLGFALMISMLIRIFLLTRMIMVVVVIPVFIMFLQGNRQLRVMMVMRHKVVS